MKKSELRQLIREEISRVISEAPADRMAIAAKMGSRPKSWPKPPTTYEIEYATSSTGGDPNKLDAKRTVEKYGLQLLKYKGGPTSNPVITIKGTPQKLHVFFKKVYDMDHDDYIDWAVG